MVGGEKGRAWQRRPRGAEGMGRASEGSTGDGGEGLFECPSGKVVFVGKTSEGVGACKLQQAGALRRSNMVLWYMASICT